MVQELIPEFVVIDDDSLNNVICETIIRFMIPEVTVQTFTEPEKGIEYIRSAYSSNDVKAVVILLDINMPSLTGWDVLDIFNNFPDPIKRQIKIFMLSSSVDPMDEEKAVQNPLVTGYIQKSLSQIKMQTFFPEYTKAITHLAGRAL